MIYVLVIIFPLFKYSSVVKYLYLSICNYLGIRLYLNICLSWGFSGWKFSEFFRNILNITDPKKILIKAPRHLARNANYFRVDLIMKNK